MQFLMFLDSKDRRSENDTKPMSNNWRYLWSTLLILSLLIFIIVSFDMLIQFDIDLFQNTLFWFVISGILPGLYYGLFNDRIFHYPTHYANKSDKRNEFAKINAVWIHVVSGFVGGISAYYLLNSLKDSKWTFNSFGWAHLILFLVAFLGYTGLFLCGKPKSLEFLAVGFLKLKGDLRRKKNYSNWILTFKFKA